MQIVRRHLAIDFSAGRSAFLWGPRKVGKTYWIHEHFLTGKEAVINLLETDTFAEYAARPALLRERVERTFPQRRGRRPDAGADGQLELRWDLHWQRGFPVTGPGEGSVR